MYDIYATGDGWNSKKLKQSEFAAQIKDNIIYSNTAVKSNSCFYDQYHRFFVVLSISGIFPASKSNDGKLF